MINQKNLSVFFFLFILIFPSGFSFYFNGVPFLNKFETLTTIIFFPLFLFLIYKKKFFRFNFYIIYLILIFKIILIFSPKNGISHFQYIKGENEFIKTVNSFWNKSTFLQENDLDNKRKFYFETKLDFKSYQDYINYETYFKSAFYLVINDQTKFRIDSGSNGKVSPIKIVNAKSLKNANLKNKSFPINLEKGIYYVETNGFFFNGLDWKFVPEIQDIKTKKFYSAISRGLVLKNYNDYYSINKIKFLINIGIIYQLIIGIFVLIVFINFFYKLNKKNYIYSLFFLIAIFFFHKIITYSSMDERFHTANISLGLVSLFILIIYNKDIKFFNSFENQIVSICFPILIFCIYFFSNQLELSGWWDTGDDWSFFSNVGKKIVIENDWLVAGEPVFRFRPLMRYFFSFSYVVFGHQSFPIKILDVYSILGLFLSVFYIQKKINIRDGISFLFSIILLILFFGDNFRWLIGRGLPEYIASFVIYFSIYLIIKYKFSLNNILLISMLGVIGVWMREDHIFIILSLIFVFLMIKENSLVYSIYNYLKNNLKSILLYFSILFFGFGLIFIRNYFLGSSFGIFDHANVTGAYEVKWYHDFYNLFFVNGTDLPIKVSSVFMISALFITIISIFNKKLHQVDHFYGFIIIFLSSLFPFLFVDVTGYPPRFVIHILPVALIIVSKYLDSYFKNNNISVKVLR